MAADYAAWNARGQERKGRVLALTLNSRHGYPARFRFISGMNATLAGQIEISCPVSIALFAFMLIRETHGNAGVVGGGLMIAAGVVLTKRNNSCVLCAE